MEDPLASGLLVPRVFVQQPAWPFDPDHSLEHESSVGGLIAELVWQVVVGAGEVLRILGAYRVADVKVTLVKVVSLPDDEIGLGFSFASNPPNCCSLSPRLALPPGPSGAVPSTTVAIPRSDITSDGTLELNLSEKGGSTVPFTIDLPQLGARLP